ncbi:MAG: hypothetical protein M1833_006170 [Piccolia ochrophora]|nr:MAG: hypothetical protein M1833_006170 [Piccolia ochrophora]
MDRVTQNDLALNFRRLHDPTNPLVLCNVHDAATASVIASLESARAIATASYSVAVAQGVVDDDMTLDQNLATVRKIAPVAHRAKLPFTVDAQGGYGARLVETITALVELGAVGCNLEDLDEATGKVRGVEEAAGRIREALDVATNLGVPNFAINARTDILAEGASIDQAVTRGQAYLAAGSNTVFVWGGPHGRGVSSAEVRRLAEAFQGRLNVIVKIGEGFLTVNEIRTMRVARISVGPQLFRKALETFELEARKLLDTAA